MIQGRRIGKRILALGMAMCMMLPVQASDLKTNEKKKQELEQQQQAAKQDVKDLQATLEGLVTEMRATKEALVLKENDIAKTEEMLIAAKLTEREQATRMEKRIRYLYENGNVSMVEVLLSAEDMADFISKAEYVSMVSEYDTNLLHNYKDTVEQVEAKEQQLQKDYEKLGKLQAQISEKQKKVETLLSEKSTQLANISSKISDLNTLIADAKEAERKRQEAAASEKNNTTTGTVTMPTKPVVSGNGQFTHPCPGMSYQSSYFGEVRQGIGDTRPHKGHDYAAAKGTPIYAAAAGTVIIAGYSSSAGNWVVIDHGNGLTTKYMHMYAHPLVSAGQKVVKGQQIGGVGTTGQSTGNHLHFQVEEYGVAVNPDKYL